MSSPKRAKPDRAEPSVLGRDAQRRIGARLERHYEAFAQEPLPTELLQLAQKLNTEAAPRNERASDREPPTVMGKHSPKNDKAEQDLAPGLSGEAAGGRKRLTQR